MSFNATWVRKVGANEVRAFVPHPKLRLGLEEVARSVEPLGPTQLKLRTCIDSVWDRRGSWLLTTSPTIGFTSCSAAGAARQVSMQETLL
jgi:hypothetical protein